MEQEQRTGTGDQEPMKDLILGEIHRVQRGEITPIAAVNTITDWIQEEIENAVKEECSGWREIAEDEENRVVSLEYASWTTGTPDMFSNEMRGFWNT